MKKILFINGSAHEFGCTYTALKEVADELKKHGVESEFIWLGNDPVQDCIACRSCKKTGRCAIDNDLVNVVADKLDECSGIIVGSPVYYAGASGKLCSFLDRLFFSSQSKMSGKIGAAVVNCRRGGASAAFERLNFYFTIGNMIVPSSQYWNQTHGNTVEEIIQDEEGLQTMRTLGINIAWLLNNLDGVKNPNMNQNKRRQILSKNSILN